MNSKLLKRLGIMAILVLAMLVFSQGLWLWEQLEQEKQTFTSKIEGSLQGIINFHALQGYSTPNPIKTDVATISMGKMKNNEINKNISSELGRSEINTNEYVPNFALGKLIEATFTDKSLSNKKIKLNIVDSLFQNNFPEIDKIQAYRMQLIKNDSILDRLYYGEVMDKVRINSLATIHIRFPLGTKGTYIYTSDLQLETFPFLRQMIFSIGISAFAIILVAIFTFWLLWTLQQQMAQLKWREQAVSGIVHDLKSPLSYVYTFLDYLASKEHLPTTQKQLKDASTNVAQLTNKMEILLTLFRGKKKMIIMEPSPYNLKQKCIELLSELKIIYQDKQIESKLSISENFVIYVDSLYFDAALRNLLDNALKYSSAYAKLEIKAFRKKKHLNICIRDSGQGIPKKEQHKIFHEFYRADSKSKGHGIGLAFTRQIVKAFKGNISLQSEVGKGSTFHIILPMTIII